MRSDERIALAAVQFNWAVTPDQIWSPIEHHVDSLHDGVVKKVLASFGIARNSPSNSPIGIALEGQKGVGKTHLLGWLRQQVQDTGGYFFLIKLVSGSAFWPSAVRGIMEGFLAGSGDQLVAFITRIGDRAGLDPTIVGRLCGEDGLTRSDLDEFIAGLRRLDRQIATECQNTARALILSMSPDSDLQEIGWGYFELTGDVEADDRKAWGFRRGDRPAQYLLRDLSSLLALTGPSVIAVDQLDSLLVTASTAGTAQDRRAQDRIHLVNEVADGLMELRELTRRTLTIVACLPATWELIDTQATLSTADRFRVVTMQTLLPSPEVARELVALRLANLYHHTGFVPPYPTWPVLPGAFEERSALEFTPRGLLQRVDEHVSRCLDADELVEMASFSEDPGVRPAVAATGEELAFWDHRYDELRSREVDNSAMDPAKEDRTMPQLLRAALSALITELGDFGRSFALDPTPGPKPALHARLRQTLDEQSDDERHWSFRGVASTNARAALTRLRAARTESGLEAANGKRQLIVVRNTPWSPGPKTMAERRAVDADGGLSLLMTADDLRTFLALQELSGSPEPGFLRWLRARQPASGTELFRRVFPDLLDGGPGAEPAKVSPEPSTAGRRPANGGGDSGAVAHPLSGDERRSAGTGGKQQSAGAGGEQQLASTGRGQSDSRVERQLAEAEVEPGTPDSGFGRGSAGAGTDGTSSGADGSRAGAPVVVLGVETSGRAFGVPLETLRKHLVVFAGSGSGKTVMLRRLIEECALHGVSTIVLDPNNDLARLGDAWPAPPAGWFPGDEAKARDYLAGTEVLVWTPGRSRGRPLVFRPLPDFSDVLDDEDEFRDAREMAVSGLLQRARLTGRKAHNGRAVLHEALQYFALDGGGELTDFIDLLSDLPNDVSSLRGAPRLAAEMADSFAAARVNDPLFGGSGQALDPGVLLTPSPGKRARISVISFVGLPQEDQRQSFVNQLQMALFAWIKRNPAGDRPLGGLFVMDEAQNFAPSGAATASTDSTLALVSQARKYGLGLVFATQAPKGLHNRIPGNATTQYYGLLNVLTQINAAQELARAKGGRVDDIARLTAGEFYASTEGTSFHRVRVPLCLSHHPPSPPSPEEVIERARRNS